jgi:hypothetical protein
MRANYFLMLIFGQNYKLPATNLILEVKHLYFIECVPILDCSLIDWGGKGGEGGQRKLNFETQ